MRLFARKALALVSALFMAGATAACSDGGTDSDELTPPLGVTAQVLSTTSVRVTWNQVPGATGYTVERAAAGGTFAQVGTTAGTFYEDTGLVPGAQYRYRVAATDGGDVSEFSSEVTATTTAEGPKVRTLSGFISANTTLYADTTYVLSGYVKVTNAATLTIQPGTRIVGDTTVAGSSLWILRGSRIVAEGTAQAPIVFTSQRAPGNRRPGDWGGLIIIGNAPINRTVNPIFTEGPEGAKENYAGGTNFNDNSGSLRYVRVEFAGYDVSNGQGQELNGISAYAVGRGTRMEYVQVMSGLDDSFEWWGGGPDARFLVSYESGDDHYDWSEGYQGRNQYVIALQTTVIQPRAGAGTTSPDPRGIEADGCANDTPGCTFANTPFSSPVFANFTLIGPGAGVYASNDGSGAVFRRGTGGTLVNGVIARWPGVGISVRNSESNTLLGLDSLMVRNVVLSENGSNFEPVGTNFGANLNVAGNNISTAADAEALFLGVPATGAVPTAAGLDFAPATGSVLTAGGMASFAGTPIEGRVSSFFGGTVTATAYRGAADPAGAKWWQGWTNYARN